MNKEKFIKELSKKLTILNEEERNDIINEYIDMIEEKVKHGKTEEEAVKDFGNISDLAKEIISTYKVDPNYQKDAFSNVEKVISDGAKKLTQITNDIVDNVKSSETAPSLENVFELIIKLFLILLSFAVLSVPFYFISSLGESLLSSSNMFGFGLLGAAWKIIASVMYYVVCILIIVSFVRNYTNKNQKPEEKKVDKEKKKTSEKISTEKKEKIRGTSSGEIISTLILLIVKIWICILFLFPLWMIIIFMALLLSLVVYFIIKGAEIYGIFILLIGSISFGSYLSKIIFEGLFKSRKISFYPFIISIIVILIGGFMTFDYFVDFTFYDSAPRHYEMKTKSYLETITDRTYVINADEYEIDNHLKDNEVKIDVSYYPEAMELKNIRVDNECNVTGYKRCLFIEHDSKAIKKFNFNREVNERVIEILKTKEVYDYSQLTDISVIVYTNEKTKDLVK